MIYTVTVNPSLDYYMHLDAPFSRGEINRAAEETVVASGKGVNVSVVLHRLGAKTCALGFLAGQSGEMYRSLLADCPNDFIFLDGGMTRINVKVYDGAETAFNAAGPTVSAADFEKLAAKLRALTPEDTLVLSGNLQKNAPVSYAEMARLAVNAGASFVVDTTGQTLLDCLPLRPFFIKPNLEELGELFGTDVQDAAQALPLCRELQNRGARNVLVSMGGSGALLLTERGEAYRAVCECKKPVLATVGAGDSLVAGFLSKIAQGGSPADALLLGIAAGSATAYTKLLAQKAQIENLMPYIRLETVSKKPLK